MKHGTTPYPRLRAAVAISTLAVALAARAEDRPVPPREYAPDWGSLASYEAPDWFRDAKFGIFMHWGVQSVRRRRTTGGSLARCTSSRARRGAAPTTTIWP